MKKNTGFPEERIVNQIHVIRGQKVMIDHDLAVLYGVDTTRLKEAVRRTLPGLPKTSCFNLLPTSFQFKGRKLRPLNY